MSGLHYKHVGQVWNETMIELADPPRGVPLPWWPKFSDLVGGLRPYELTLLCAPTGSGKTQLLANIAAQLVLSGTNVFAAPVETGDIDFVTRMVSAVEGTDLNTGDAINPSVLVKIDEKLAAPLFSRGLYIATYDNRVEIHEMIRLLKYMHDTYGVAVAMLDNLNFFLSVVSSQHEKAEMDNAIHEFVMLAKQLPMHVILIVHPKKTEGGRVVSEFDIKGSSTAVQEASNVLLFNRKAEDDSAHDRFDRELVFRKIRRRGANVGMPVWLSFRSGRYEELVQPVRYSP